MIALEWTINAEISNSLLEDIVLFLLTLHATDVNYNIFSSFCLKNFEIKLSLNCD